MTTTNPYAVLASLDGSEEEEEKKTMVTAKRLGNKKKFHIKTKGTRHVFIGHMATAMDWQWIQEEASLCGTVVSVSPTMYFQHRASSSTTVTETLAKGTKCYHWATITMETVAEASTLMTKIGKNKYRQKKDGIGSKPRIYAEWASTGK
jgi:hypothetical protein